MSGILFPQRAMLGIIQRITERIAEAIMGVVSHIERHIIGMIITGMITVRTIIVAMAMSNVAMMTMMIINEVEDVDDQVRLPDRVIMMIELECSVLCQLRYVL